jgi:hypothetical protein
LPSYAGKKFPGNYFPSSLIVQEKISALGSKIEADRENARIFGRVTLSFFEERFVTWAKGFQGPGARPARLES